jgi:hypothetical protein
MQPVNFSLYFSSTSFATKMVESHPMRPPPLVAPPLQYIIRNPPHPHVFGWLLCAPMSIGGHLRQGVFSLYYCCVSQFDNQNVGMVLSNLLHLLDASLLLHILSAAGADCDWLVVVCCRLTAAT